MKSSYLLDEQVREIVAFDFKRRTGREYDGRRYGSITGERSPKFTADWAECYGVNPQDVRNGVQRKNPSRKTLRYNYILHDGIDKGCDVIVLHVAVRLNAYYQPVVKDVNAFYTRTGETWARDLSYRQVAGWCVAWQHKDIFGLKADKGKEYLVGTGVWGRCPGAWKYGLGENFPYHETINPSALKGTRFEYCQYADNGTGKTGLIDWLMLYRDEPKVELLAKMGFYALISPMGLKALKEKTVFDWVRKNADAIRKVSGDWWGPREIVYAARHSITIKEAQRHFDFVRKVSRYLDSAKYYAHDEWCWKNGRDGMPRKDGIRLDYVLLRKRFARWRIQVEEYVRYLEYAIRSGLDWKNEGTLYPPTKGGRRAFMERLEALEREANRRRKIRKREERRQQRIAEAERLAHLKALFAERAVEIEAFQKSLARSKTLTGCGYRIVLAKTQEELRQEGKKMHNCVGSGHYGEGIVAGDLLIVMLKDASGKSYCDIEIRRKDWTVRQCYLKSNQNAPDEVRSLAQSIAEIFKKEFAKRQKNIEKEARRKSA